MSLNANDFDQTVEKYHQALDEFMKGNCAPAWMEAGRGDDGASGITLQGRRRHWLREHSEVCHAGACIPRRSRTAQVQGWRSERRRASGVTRDERLSPGRWALEDRASSRRSDNNGSACRFSTPPIDAAVIGRSGSVSQKDCCGSARASAERVWPVSAARSGGAC